MRNRNYKKIMALPCYPADCNRCATKCSGNQFTPDCRYYMPPPEGFMLAECALSHPQSLHDALSALPFDTNLNFYLK